MTNELFAMLMPIVLLLAMACAGGLLFWDIKRRHPIRTAKAERSDNTGEVAPDKAGTRGRVAQIGVGAE
jgi:multidrug resistance efflux pump